MRARSSGRPACGHLAVQLLPDLLGGIEVRLAAGEIDDLRVRRLELPGLCHEGHGFGGLEP